MTPSDSMFNSVVLPPLSLRVEAVEVSFADAEGVSVEDVDGDAAIRAEERAMPVRRGVSVGVDVDVERAKEEEEAMTTRGRRRVVMRKE